MSGLFPVAPREWFERGLELLKARAAKVRSPDLLMAIADKGPALIDVVVMCDAVDRVDDDLAGHIEIRELRGQNRRAFVHVSNDGGWVAFVFDGNTVEHRVVVTAMEAAVVP